MLLGRENTSQKISRGPTIYENVDMGNLQQKSSELCFRDSEALCAHGSERSHGAVRRQITSYSATHDENVDIPAGGM